MNIFLNNVPQTISLIMALFGVLAGLQCGKEGRYGQPHTIPNNCHDEDCTHTEMGKPRGFIFKIVIVLEVYLD